MSLPSREPIAYPCAKIMPPEPDPIEPATRFKRRLAAVAFADVAGWSLQVGLDDAGTLQAWKNLRSQVIEPLIRAHDGVVLEIQGDALLVEFGSAVAAVNWAVDVQRGSTQVNAGGGTEALQLRIGINVEDVIVDDGKLIGDGVNIASRIHQAAGVGEVVATANVRELVRNKCSVEFIDLGEHQFKHISRKIQVFRVQPAASGARISASVQPNRSWGTRPAIAVLPFRTLGGEPDDSYFGEGITEDIINALSRSHSFYVIARNSTLRYRDIQGDLPRVADELGVRYVLQGSVRRSAPRLRITCELADATNQRTILSERFDGTDDDIFLFQDRIAAGIVGKLEPKLLQVESVRALQKPTENLDAYDCVLRALPFIYAFDCDRFDAAGESLRMAIRLDPGYAQAHAWLAWWYNLALGENRSDDFERDRAMARRMAMVGTELDPEDAFCLAVAAHLQAYLHNSPELAADAFERAILLNENSAFAWGMSAPTLCYLGDPESALERLRNAWRLSPFDPLNFVFWTVAGIAEFLAGRNDQAIAWLRKSQRANPRFVACHRTLTAALSTSGDMDAARLAASDLLRVDPMFRVSTFAARYPLRGPGHLERMAHGLLAAGLPA
jgi:adenylate cyclase